MKRILAAAAALLISVAALAQQSILIKGGTLYDGSVGGHPRAFRRSTGLVADTYGIRERGYVRPGYYADIVVFNPETITDCGTYTDPQRYAKGFRAVIVNGQVEVADDVYTNVLSGRIIKKENK